MTSEDQTVDHTNKIEHDTIFVRFHTSFRNGKTQTFKTVFKRPYLVHRPPTRHVLLSSLKFDQKNHTTASLVRSWNNIPVITSQKHWNETSGLVGHPKMMSFHTRTSTHMNFRESAVAHHKHAVGRPESWDGDSGHGSFEGGRAHPLDRWDRCHFCEDLGRWGSEILGWLLHIVWWLRFDQKCMFKP